MKFVFGPTVAMFIRMWFFFIDLPVLVIGLVQFCKFAFNIEKFTLFNSMIAERKSF